MIMSPADSEARMTLLARVSSNFPGEPTCRLTESRIQLLQIIFQTLQHLQLKVWILNVIIRLPHDS
jgi:hypothetical protein